MQASYRFVITRTVMLMGLGAFVAFGNWHRLDAQGTQAPGGFVEHATSTAYRTPPTAAQIAAFLPATRGRFSFPAPYNTEAYRLTVPADCGGGDCVQSTGYSHWRNINNHAGRPEVRVFLSLAGATGYGGPTLFTINKATGAVTTAPIFQSAPFSYARAIGWYWSATNPDILYATSGSRVVRVNVVTGQQTVVLDLNTRPAGFFPQGTQWRVEETSSSDDGNVHVGSAQIDGAPYTTVGCYVFEEATNEWTLLNTPHNCFVDKSGRYVSIYADTDGDGVYDLVQYDTVLNTYTSPYLSGRQGGAGHADRGFGYIITEDGWYNAPQAMRLWDLTQPWTAPGQGLLVHSMTRWAGDNYGQPAFGNALPRSVKPIDQQYMCTQNTFAVAPSPPAPREREVVCFRLDGSQQMLVVAPTLADMAAPGGGEVYWRAPKGNLDTTGEYYIWTANMGGNRLEAFLVRIPHQLLTGGFPDPVPPTVGVTAPAGGATVSGTSVTLSANAADNVGVAGVTFRVDGSPIGAEDTAAPYSVTWNSTTVGIASHTVTATARDAAGNVTTSAPVSITVSNGTAPTNDLIVDFGAGPGLWALRQTTWLPVHAANPNAMVSGDFDGNGLDDLAVDFPSYGVWLYMNQANWIQLHTSSPTLMAAGDLDNSGRDELILSFPGYGIWSWRNHTNWQFLSPSQALRVAVGDIDGGGADDLIVDVATYGLWAYRNNTTWGQLNPNNVTALTVGDLDNNGQADVVASFAAYGIWIYRNNTSWTFLHPYVARVLAHGQLDGGTQADLVIDFGSVYGVWLYKNAIAWSQLHSYTSQGLVVADFDGDTRDEIVIGFGAAGLWRNNNGVWTFLHPYAVDALSASRIH